MILTESHAVVVWGEDFAAMKFNIAIDIWDTWHSKCLPRNKG